MSTYLFDQAWQAERTRLSALERQWDAATRSHLSQLGVGPGDSCLEIGCGAGGVALWLADAVGPTGRVVATDLDPRFVLDHDRGNLEVREHDIVTGPLETDTFDLVHARAVLMHVGERDAALARMVAATRPGGWVLIEDLDVGGTDFGWFLRHFRPASEAALVERVGMGIVALFRRIGAEPEYGCRLPDAMAAAGLVDIGAEIHAPLTGGGPENFLRLTVEQLGPALTGAGLVTEEDVSRALTVLGDPGCRESMIPMVSVWGRRPG